MPAKIVTPEIGGFEKQVDELFGLEKKITDLKSKADVIETTLKEKGTSILREKLEHEYGSVNLVGSDILGQVQVRHASVSISNDKIDEARKLLGEKFDAFFDVTSTIIPGDSLNKDKIAEIKKLLLAAGKDPSDFFSSLTILKTASANDNWLDSKKRKLLGINEKKFESVNEIAKVKGAIGGVFAWKWVPKKD
jgi:hypothetical protein